MREFQTQTIQTGIKAPDGRAMERVVLGFELKSLDDEGRGTGFLSVYGNEDSYGDVVESGAFVKTCAERSADNPLPFLWQHNGDEPIGIYTRLDPMHERGLYTEFSYAMGVQRAREAFDLAKMRACKGQSIGYTTLQDHVDKSTGLRHLKELRLWEGSQVTFPANDLADISGVKSALVALGFKIGDLPPADRNLDEAAAYKALIDEIKGHRPGGPAQATREAAHLAADIKSYLTSR